MFQQFQNLRQNQNSPQEILKNMIDKYTPEQLQDFRKFAVGFGITDEQLNKVGINTK